ncbi:gamma-glutamyl-gamma-aminobutyrate hydrolase family protein [Virgibacillus ihumii]|uniref:gamma-glutamyl-gamma-aminobutyrate hydrolase family protein n=1 Tax=Virgibacillus ihumii TaxID=2686091 RepID=UPI00157D8A80|nr:gamma-glutamyl-gamma-aminobutyrate hydrolase family protein [Virgibacillus ihumii]
MKPLIGITAHIDNGDPNDLYPGHPLIYTDHQYVKALENHEMMVVIIPVIKNQSEIPYYLDFLDGIVLTGGGYLDLDIPIEHTSTLRGTGDERFSFESALLDSALRLNMPILGICRGMQMINEVLGGTLKTLTSDDHHQEIRGIAGSIPTHDIIITPDSKLGQMLEKNEISVNSFHRQVIDIPGKGIQVVGWSQSDGLIEAIESHHHSWVLGMQFHPEQLLEGGNHWGKLFKSLREAAVTYQQSKNLSSSGTIQEG